MLQLFILTCSLFNEFDDKFSKQIMIVGYECLMLNALLNHQYRMQLYL